MKYLVLFAVVLVIIWFIRNNRRADEPGDKPPRKDALAPPQDMVRCPVCSVHLPRSDALPGPDGRMYCCADHLGRAAGD
jgi:uncharacterized protein